MGSAQHSYCLGLFPRTRAGSIRTARKKANKASNVMPINRNGKEINHTSGHSSSASKASGQQRISRINQARKVSIGPDFCRSIPFALPYAKDIHVFVEVQPNSRVRHA